MARTGFPGELEHFAAYSGSTAIAMAGYGLNKSRALIIGAFWLYAGLLEYVQHFSPGRHPAFLDFASSAFGVRLGCFGAWSSSASRYLTGTLPEMPRSRSNESAPAAAGRAPFTSPASEIAPPNRPPILGGHPRSSQFPI